VAAAGKAQEGTGPTVPIDRPTDAFPPSLVLSFDASVHYGPAHAKPVSGAIGYVVAEGTETRLSGSERVDHLVSSSALEFRALLEAVAATVERFDDVASLHIRGDADAVVEAVDPRRDAMPRGGVSRRRVHRVRRLLAPIPTVTYRVVPRELNERAHHPARAGHGR